MQSTAFMIAAANRLSRMEAQKAGDLARFNMPLELGIDLGCRRYRGGKHQEKRCLILDKEKYRYQKAISDLSGNDIAYHGEDPEKMVRQVRNWIYHIKKEKLPSGKSIWTTYNEFAYDFEKITQQEGYSREDIATMPWSECMDYIREWMGNRKR